MSHTIETSQRAINMLYAAADTLGHDVRSDCLRIARNDNNDGWVIGHYRLGIEVSLRDSH